MACQAARGSTPHVCTAAGRIMLGSQLGMRSRTTHTHFISSSWHSWTQQVRTHMVALWQAFHVRLQSET